MISCRSKLAALAGAAFFVVCAAPETASAQMTWTDRAFVNFSVGQQWMDQSLTSSGSLVVYEETATWSAPLAIDDSFLFDVGGGVKVWRNLGLGVSYSATNDTHASTLTARIPDVLRFDSFHTSSREIADLKREEQAFHISALWMIPVTDRIDVAILGGPSFFTVKQPYVNNMTVTAGASTINTVATAEIDESATGYHIGVDGTVRILRNLGVGFLARYASAKIDTPQVDPASLDVGGFQGLIGIRARF